ncbi:MAG: hypothetical protein IJ856_07715 [Candidatus Methanomethylophilaceae archaeon]|nr:hypothetical protein [Candidatus Methanomethylophilaceae archaeon]
MFRVAFYGKGGIGKSTVSSNVSYVLASEGRTVHIGCDPKHDSTRLLLGRDQDTVLDLPRKGRLDAEHALVTGKGGVICVESGGPKPGVGCAGKGIITSFSLLQDLGLSGIDADYMVYDVLGDVVCGGFAVPLRPDRCDGVILVTSGEFMSLYACNNILRGIRGLSGDSKRILGIVANLRGDRDEHQYVSAFARTVGLPVIATVPRSEEITECERRNEPVCALFPESKAAVAVRDIASRIRMVASGVGEMYSPEPLDDCGMTAIARGEVPEKAVQGSFRRERPVMSASTVLETCSAAGAVDIGYYVDDLDILLHSPDSCAYIFSSFHDRMFSVDAPLRTLSFIPSGRKMFCTGIRDMDSIFGAVGLLREKLEDMISRGRTDIMVVTTCMAGIIGDDVGSVVESVSAAHPGVTITPVLCDGNMTGHMGEGLYMASTALLRYVDMSVEPEPDRVNILGMSFMKLSYKDKTEALQGLLDLFGLKVNCMYIGGCTLEQIRNLRRARFNLLMSNVKLAKELGDHIEKECGIPMLDAPAPIG